MKLGVAQIDCEVGEVEQNCLKLKRYMELAGQEGCEAVVFPELCDTGYDLSVIARKASDWEGLAMGTLKESAKNRNVAAVCGLTEKAGDRLYSSLAVVDRS